MDREAAAITLMKSFSERTGLVGDRPPRRYLWTDAFAVCTFVSLQRRRPGEGFIELARTLITQVHEVLGRHVDGRPLGSMDEASHAAHPTRHGLRIGKPLPERTPGQLFDERLEWERDGQYFHYLTRWMHALECYARATRNPEPHHRAVELCEAGMSFVERDPAGRPLRMAWKRSVDLDRVLVASMGQHDPLDGWITAAELAASPFVTGEEREQLSNANATWRALDTRRNWPTADPLGIGGVLNAAVRRWFDRGPDDASAATESRGLLEAAAVGFRGWLSSRTWEAPARQRLAFRELGLTIGLHATDALRKDPACAPVVRRAAHELQVLAEALPDMPAFWWDARNRAVPSWTDHPDINAVMLAASLVPEEPNHVPI
jgi:hypothetical protein